MTADELLVRHVRDGHSVVVAPGAAEPATLAAALMAIRHSYRDLQVVLALSVTGAFKPEHADVVRFVLLGAFGHLHALAEAPRARILPVHYGLVPTLLREGAVRADVLMVQVAPPDADGTCSVGLAAEYLPAAIAAAPTILAEINDQVPVVEGAPTIPLGRLAGAIHTSRPLPGVTARPSGERGVAVGRHLATIVGDGATLQVGVGGLLDAALEGLGGRRDLRIHSGLASDAVRGLATAGALATAAGAMTATALLGTPELYAWAAGSGLVLRDVSWTHDPRVISSLRGFFAVNAALQVDLQGRVNAELADGAYVGGVGGAPAFAHAARHSPGGGSVFILPSTTRAGASRIVPALEGATATTPAADVSFVVTEHGVADLRHATCDERIRRLVAIAAPSSRDALGAAA